MFYFQLEAVTHYYVWCALPVGVVPIAHNKAYYIFTFPHHMSMYNTLREEPSQINVTLQ